MSTKTIENSGIIPYSRLFEVLSGYKVELSSRKIYKLICDLKDMVYPRSSEGSLNIYSGFYLPIAIDGKNALIPFRIEEHKGRLIFDFEDQNLSYAVVKDSESGEDKDKEVFMEMLLTSSKKLMENLRTMDKSEAYFYLDKNVPYSFRKGYVRSRFLKDHSTGMDEWEAKRIYSDYKEFCSKGYEIESVSLHDYLDTAYLCYKVFFGKEELGNLSTLSAYKKYADFRDGGMLSLKMRRKEKFEDWYHSDRWKGSHPFEIISGYSSYVLLLYPPLKESPQYWVSLNMDQKSYYTKYLNLAKALIKEKIPFRAAGLDYVAKYVEGDMIVPVNRDEANSVSFPYFGDIEKDSELSKNILWERLKVPNFKGNDMLRR